MFDELILHGEQIHQYTLYNDRKVIIPVRLPWYRNLAIAVLEMLNFTIDGRKYTSAADEVKIKIAGEDTSVQEICTDPKYRKIIWCNLDTQEAVIALDAPLTEGDHEVEMEMRVGLPYKLPIDIPPTFPQYVTHKKTMKFVKGDN